MQCVSPEESFCELGYSSFELTGDLSVQGVRAIVIHRSTLGLKLRPGAQKGSGFFFFLIQSRCDCQPPGALPRLGIMTIRSFFRGEPASWAGCRRSCRWWCNRSRQLPTSTCAADPVQATELSVVSSLASRRLASAETRHGLIRGYQLWKAVGSLSPASPSGWECHVVTCHWVVDMSVGGFSLHTFFCLSVDTI